MDESKHIYTYTMPSSTLHPDQPLDCSNPYGCGRHDALQTHSRPVLSGTPQAHGISRAVPSNVTSDSPLPTPRPRPSGYYGRSNASPRNEICQQTKTLLIEQATARAWRTQPRLCPWPLECSWLCRQSAPLSMVLDRPGCLPRRCLNNDLGE